MTTAIILMAGMGSRMQATTNKMLLQIEGVPLYEMAINLFKGKVQEILLVVSEVDYPFLESLNLGYKLVIGGKTRQESVLNALKEVKTDRVLIHDGARILTPAKIIDAALKTNANAYFVATKVIPTIRYDETKGFQTLDRNHLLEVQTPQGGNTALFLHSALAAYENKAEVTDDISTLATKDIEVIEGSPVNIKITTPFDLHLAKFLMKEGK